jgi:hypothetical protein
MADDRGIAPEMASVGGMDGRKKNFADDVGVS